ncbi:MAG: Ig-like domain-containing protein, partial [Terriglobales bacterium]
MKSNFSSSVLTAVLLLLLSLSAMAQYTETVIHSFSGSDGIGPQGLIADSHGNLYGTAPTGGNSGAGVVFELSPPGTGSGPWMETVLHSFTGGSDGGTPVVGLTLDSRGNLYGAANGGTPTSGSNGCVPGQGCGVVYELSPPLSGSGPWTQTILYSFAGGTDGSNPVCLAMSPGGDLFGVLRTGGPAGLGSVFELSPPGSGSGAWTKTVLFDEGGAFSYPFVFDRQGNVYGTLQPSGYGTVFEFSPPAGGSGAWTVSSLYSFKGGTDGDGPVGSLLLDSQGNLYGATTYGGATYFCTWLDNIGCGEIFELSPPGAGGGAWTKTVPYIFSSSNGIYPSGGVTFDAVGNLYGTTSTGGDTSSCIGTYVSGCGIVFKLYPLAGSFGTWTEVVPYIFTGGTDGAEPDSGLIVDSHGNLYGTANSGGVSGDGVVFELSPHTTTTSLASSANPSVIGQDVLFTATVSPAGTAAPTGSVSFMAGGSIIGGCSGVVLSPSLTATCSTVTLPLGTNTVTAIYWGDSTYAGSTGVLAQVVTTGSASSQTTLSSSINPSTKGQSVTLTATVDPAGPPIPTGTVSFTSNAVDISGCTAVALSSSRTATCTATALPVGTDAMIAAYSGDANYSSSSGALSQLVNPVPTAVQFVPVSPCRVVDTRTA